MTKSLTKSSNKEENQMNYKLHSIEKSEYNPCCFSYFDITDHQDIEWLTGLIFAGNLKAPEHVLLIPNQNPKREETAQNCIPPDIKISLENKFLQNGYTLKWQSIKDEPCNVGELPHKANELQQIFGKKIAWVAYCFKL